MSNELAVRNGHAPAPATALAIQPGQLTWDKFQDAALNQIGLRNAGNADKAVFLHQCQRTGLDPFAKQIMMIERREKQGDNWVSKWTIQTGIEGWRVIRDRAERREGLRGILTRFTYYDTEDNPRPVWTRPEPPAACEVTYTVVEAGGREVPYTSVLRFTEYLQTKNDKDGRPYPVAQWKDKPVHMLEKCTEADVYRKAFPQDFSGIDLDDAMPEADAYDGPVPQRGRITADAIRARQHVTAEVITPDVPPAATEAPGSVPGPTAATNPQAEEAAAGGTPLRATDGQVRAIAGKLTSLGVNDPAGIIRTAGLIAGQQVERLQQLHRDKAGVLRQKLDECETPEDLDLLRANAQLTDDPRGDEAAGDE